MVALLWKHGSWKLPQWKLPHSMLRIRLGERGMLCRLVAVNFGIKNAFDFGTRKNGCIL